MKKTKKNLTIVRQALIAAFGLWAVGLVIYGMMAGLPTIAVGACILATGFFALLICISLYCLQEMLDRGNDNTERVLMGGVVITAAGCLLIAYECIFHNGWSGVTGLFTGGAGILTVIGAIVADRVGDWLAKRRRDKKYVR